MLNSSEKKLLKIVVLKNIMDTEFRPTECNNFNCSFADILYFFALIQ